MSDNEQSGGKAGAWTEEAKCQFLLHIIAQLKGDGKAISWSKINMPGRTTKSLQNMWTKINKTIAEMEAAASEGANTTSAKATPRKRGRKPKAVKGEDNVKGEDDDDMVDTPEKATPKKATPRKRAAGNLTPKPAKKLKNEDSDEDSKPVRSSDDEAMEQ